MEYTDIVKLFPSFNYPQTFIQCVENGITDYGAWYLLTPEQVLGRINGLQKRFPLRQLIPFARRDDNDDLACFEIDKPDRVEIIHDFSSPGYEQREEYLSFDAWQSAVNFRSNANIDDDSGRM